MDEELKIILPRSELDELFELFDLECHSVEVPWVHARAGALEPDRQRVRVDEQDEWQNNWWARFPRERGEL